jgi:hypothetical protein
MESLPVHNKRNILKSDPKTSLSVAVKINLQRRHRELRLEKTYSRAGRETHHLRGLLPYLLGCSARRADTCRRKRERCLFRGPSLRLRRRRGLLRWSWSLLGRRSRSLRCSLFRRRRFLVLVLLVFIFAFFLPTASTPVRRISIKLIYTTTFFRPFAAGFFAAAVDFVARDVVAFFLGGGGDSSSKSDPAWSMSIAIESADLSDCSSSS